MVTQPLMISIFLKKKHTVSASSISNKYMVDLTAVHNKFSPLDEMSEESEIENSSQQQTPKIKIPPIFIHEINNYQQIIKDLDNIAANNYSTQQQGKTLKVNSNSIEDYRKITKFLDESKLPFHTFRDPNSKTLEVILRNVPYSLTNEEISSELLSQNFPVIKVTRLLYKNKQPMPLCVVELQKNEESNNIFDLKQIQHAIITVEYRRKPKDIPQCTRCQRYGHTKNFCRLIPRCVKCPENHHYSECKKPKDVQPKCVNCGEGHPANFKGCTYYLNLKQKTNTNNVPSINRPNNTQTPVINVNLENFPHLSPSSSSSTPPRSAWVQPSVPQNKNQESNNSSPDFLSGLVESIISFLKPHLPKIQTFLMQLLTGLFNNNNAN